MLECSKILSSVESGQYDDTFAKLYPLSPVKTCRMRYVHLLDAYINLFGDSPAILVSAPGRTEIGGNHTDHQHGNVLAAAIDLDVICAAAPNGENLIRIQSDGYPLAEIDVSDLSAREPEKGTSKALARGMAQWFSGRGAKLRGFNAYVTSNVLGGLGLSSSAAYEVAIGNVMARLFVDAGVSAVDIAIAGQYAENEYLGKPCGLMDQMTSSVGGLVQIDFFDPNNPVIRPIKCTLSEHGYNLCIVDTRGSHSNLTADYKDITTEMCAIANYFGKGYLRDVDGPNFRDKLAILRTVAGDRAVLRAIHFFRDDKLAVDSANALEVGNIQRFLQNVVRSGRSSLSCLQNAYSTKDPSKQGITLALDLSETVLADRGAWRVHGGGFAGTVQAFAPDDLLQEFCGRQNALFGPGSCHVLSFRPVGGCEIRPDGEG